MNNQPKAYQQGWIEFYKLKFKVTPDTLIPRPETELLVDEVIRYLADHPEERYSDEGSHKLTILDLGTGTGNIAISIAKNVPDVKIIATDISPSALKIAKLNAKLHGVENRIKFIQSDLLKNPTIHNTKYMILVTNLPYIPTERIDYLDASVKDFEPKVALDGGEDGFELYRKLFTQIKQKGWEFKLLVGEIDYTHGEQAVTEAQKFFPQALVEVKLDLAKKQRILQILTD